MIFDKFDNYYKNHFNKYHQKFWGFSEIRVKNQSLQRTFMGIASPILLFGIIRPDSGSEWIYKVKFCAMIELILSLTFTIYPGFFYPLKMSKEERTYFRLIENIYNQNMQKIKEILNDNKANSSAMNVFSKEKINFVYHGMTPLYHAAKQNLYDVCEILLQYGADPNRILYVDNEKITPFSVLFYIQDLAMIKLFVKYGADVNVYIKLKEHRYFTSGEIYKYELTIFHLILTMPIYFIDVVDYLIESVDFSLKSKIQIDAINPDPIEAEVSCLHLCTSNRMIEKMIDLMKYKNIFNDLVNIDSITPLHVCLHTDCAKTFILNGIDPNLISKYGTTIYNRCKDSQQKILEEFCKEHGIILERRSRNELWILNCLKTIESKLPAKLLTFFEHYLIKF